MPRLANPKIIPLKESETFHFSNRELPVYENCNKGDSRLAYCISHKKMLMKGEFEDHIDHKSTHEIVSYCGVHERFEEV